MKSTIPLANVSGFTNSWNHENEPHMMEEHPLQYDLVFSQSHVETIFGIQTLNGGTSTLFLLTEIGIVLNVSKSCR